jgi:uncharacterized protein YdeI (YjbR/CyaY-like superfamily)
MEVGETLLVTTREEWREWLAQHHAGYREIWLVYYKKTSGKTGISYEEAVEEALCFGWIDGAIKGIDKETYAGRFTPRRAKSPWSDSNRERVARLLRDGRMTEVGLRVVPSDLRESF